MKEEEKQHERYQLTINNPKDHALDHDTIKKILITCFKMPVYFCMVDEIGGEQHTYHTHVFVIFSSRVRWRTVQKAFNGYAHIEVANGSIQQNLDYIKKEGERNKEKAETTVDGTFFEWGELPKDKGKGGKIGYESLYELIKDGATNAEILAINPNYARFLSQMNNIRDTIKQDEYGDAIREVRVVYICGETGTGKTESVVMGEFGRVYRVTNYKNPFDKYNYEETIAFDEFRSQLSISEMLMVVDKYSAQLSARFSDKLKCCDTVVIISNWTLEMQYENEQRRDKESWQAFLRRIDEVRIHRKNDTPLIYGSVDDYMSRNQFHVLTDEEEKVLPF